MTSAQRSTYGDYLTWPDDRNEDLIDGLCYVREPSPVPQHQELVIELLHQVRGALESKPYRVYVAPLDVCLPKSDEPDEKVDTVLQPDLLIVCDRSKVHARSVRGAPDWIAEILSPSTTRYDQIKKLPVYERAGVREVWLVHPIDRTLAIYRLDDGRYGRPEIVELKGVTALMAVPSVSIDWDRVLSRLL
jgi:Uma2 family endonuclease